MSLLTAQILLDHAPASRDGGVVLSYDERLLRRKRLVSDEGVSFLVDLPSVTNLDDFWGFRLSDGRAIEVVAAVEDLVEVRGDSLLRYAWHIGNRHTPCQIEPDRLLIRVDHVLEAMLTGLGAALARVSAPFRPEGGAYGHGRTMGHSHGEGGHHHDEASTSIPSQAPGLEPEAQPRPALAPKVFKQMPVATTDPIVSEQDASRSLTAPVAQGREPHRHGAGCGCAHHGAPKTEVLPAYQSWSPDAEPSAGQGFGWHHHGDGQMHFHAPRQPLPDEPMSQGLEQALEQALGQALTQGVKGK